MQQKQVFVLSGIDPSFPNCKSGALRDDSKKFTAGNVSAGNIA
jgi:hypothetical protein